MEIDKNFLIKESAKFKKEADLLLEKSGIIKILSKYGKVKFTGSYEVDLMMSGDIDISIINSKITKKDAVNFLNKVIKQEFFKGHLFYNYTKFINPEFPFGHYIGLKVPFRNRKWKIDIWFIKKEHNKEVKTINFVRKNLNEKNKIDILKLKYYNKIRNLDISSIEIYEMVLKHNITSLNKFLKFIK